MVSRRFPDGFLTRWIEWQTDRTEDYGKVWLVFRKPRDCTYLYQEHHGASNVLIYGQIVVSQDSSGWNWFIIGTFMVRKKTSTGDR